MQYFISGQRIEQLRKFLWCYLPFASNESSQECPIIVAGEGGGPGPKYMRQSTMGNKIWLSVHSGNFGCYKIAHLSVHMSPIPTYVTLDLRDFFGFSC